MRNFKETYFPVWKEAWEIHKRFFGILENDEIAWEQLFQEAEEFGKKYAATPEKQFAQNLILLVVGELEQKSKGDQTKGKK